MNEAADTSGGGGSAPAFDPNKFAVDLLSKIDGRLNGIDKRLSAKFDGLKASPLSTDSGSDPARSIPGASSDPKIADLEKRVQETERREKAAQAKVLTGELKSELQRFIDPVKLNAAIAMTRDQVQYDEAGNMVSIDGVPLADFVKSFATAKENEWMQIRQGSGSSQRGAGRTAAAPDLDRLKPGMELAELERFRAEIGRVASVTAGGGWIS